MVNLKYSARRKEDNTEKYTGIEEHQLGVIEKIISGDGSSDSPYKVEISIENQSKEVWDGVIHVEMIIPKTMPKFFLPGFMYGRNRGEAPLNVPNEFPRLRVGDIKRPASSWWMVRSDRLSHPAALVYDAGRVYGFHTAPFFEMNSDNGGMKKQSICPKEIYQYGGFSCNIEWDKEHTSVGYTIGYENAPWLFVQSHSVYDRAILNENCFMLEPGERINITLYVYDFEAENELGVHYAIENTYEFYHMEPRKIGSVDVTINDLANAVSKYAWIPDEHSYSGFVREDGKDGFNYNKIYSLSWTNGASVAVPLLLAANRMKDNNMRLQALECMEYLMNNCMNKSSGLPYDAYENGVWSIRGWWFDGMHTGGHSSYLSGQFIYYVLKAYENEKNVKNVDHKEWIEFIKPIIKRLNKEKNTEYEYPFVYSELNGAGIEYDSFSGAWCMAATAYYVYITGDNTYIEELELSEQHYYDKFVKHVECYGAPLDTDKAVDSEGVLAYIRACRYMHMITLDEKYINHMRAGINYEITFKFCYNVPVKYAPLSKINWSSCGGSITSTANPHIHPMSSTIVGELDYYVKQTGDEYIKKRMQDTIMWGCQTYNTYDGEYDYGRKGWMSERFCYSQGLLVETYPDGELASTWFALMPWAACSIVEGLVEV